MLAVPTEDEAHAREEWGSLLEDKPPAFHKCQGIATQLARVQKRSPGTRPCD